MNNLKKPLVFEIEKIIRTAKLNNLDNLKKNIRFKIIKARCAWTKDEDDHITYLVNLHGTKNWSMISNLMSKHFGVKNRTGKQCRERWHNHLDPNVNKNYWSAKEEAVLFIKHIELGNKWSEIANFLPGRSDNCIKNHFYSKLRKFIRKLIKQINKDNSFKTYNIDSLKYNSEKIYKMIKNNKLPYNTLTKTSVLEMILKNEKNKLINENASKKIIIKRISRKSIKNRKLQIVTKSGKFLIILNKSILNYKEVDNIIPGLDNLACNNKMVKEKDNLMNKTHNETIQNNNNPHVIHQNYLQISNFPFKNKNINNIIHQEDEQKAILQNSCANGILNFHENHNNSYDRSLCEIYKPMISPINLVNNIQGGLIFPFQSNTKNSFNLNIENYIMKPNEDESIFHYHNAHNMLTNIHHNENGNKSNFMNNYSHIFNGFSSNFQPCYGSQYHSCISPSVNCRLYEINNNTNAKEINIQKNKILINEITDNLNDEIIINTPNNNSINTGIDFGNVISINKNNDDDVTNNIRTLKENTITNNSLKNKKNSLPKLDFNTINPSETFKIFNDSLSIPCNSYNNDFDFYKFPLSNKSKIQSLFSPVEIKNDNNSYESNSFVEIKAKNNEKLIGNINVKERTLLKFNISPKSAFLLTKKN